MYRGIRLGHIAGVEINADWSVLIVFFLIAFGLANGMLPAWHPQWSVATVWVTAMGAALAFVASVLAHEMSHALVGRRGGMVIRRITLFVFGGMAHLEHEPRAWKVELRMAIAGPITSILIGIACLSWVSLSMDSLEVQSEAQALEMLAQLSPVGTILLWLGWVNIVLAVFNLVPGFPLDGGRVLRAILWGVTGDHRRATHIASMMGQGVAWILIGVGFAMVLGVAVPIFGRGFLGGMWLILIGWFLNNAALMSYRNLLHLDALSNVSVRRLMRLLPTRLEPGTPLSTLLDRYLMSSGQPVFPIEENGRFLGWVTVQDLSRSSPQERHERRVDDLMTPARSMPSLAPDQCAADAIQLLSRGDTEYLPVIDKHDRLLGVLSREELFKWLSLHREDERSGELMGG